MEFPYAKRRVHFVGVGGVSMSGLCRLAAHYGAQVSGSDRSPSRALDALQKEGYHVYCGVDPACAAQADVVVYTSAVPLTHPELQVAKTRLERSEFLGSVAACYPTVVAIAGTHGKSTVCGFLSSILLHHGAAFCAHIGAYVPCIGGNVHLGGEDIFLTEACEYRRHFLTLSPTIGVITNVEYDHPDTYASPEDLRRAYADFGSRCRTLVCNDGVVCSLVHTDTRLYAHPFIPTVQGDEGALELMFLDTYIRAPLAVWGDFNRVDAALAASVALLLGIPVPTIVAGLSAYRGAERRQQMMGVWRDMTILSDYAHHPTEIAAVTRAAKKRYGSIAVVFQPHTYSRSLALMAQFAHCFVCDCLFYLPTYAAREAPDPMVDRRLFDEIAVPIKWLCDEESLLARIQQKTPHKKYGAILFVGAGDVHRFSIKLLQKS